MVTPEFDFHPPSRIIRILEKLRLREVCPADIVPLEQLDKLYKKYPDLGGDRNIGFSDSMGACQSWRDCPEWWKSFILPPKSRGTNIIRLIQTKLSALGIRKKSPGTIR
jgi:hypothetical protein